MAKGRTHAREGDKQRAYDLLKEGLTQKRVARILGYDPSTIARWSKQGGWAERLGESHVTFANIEESLQFLYEHQVKCMRQAVELSIEEGKPMTPIGKGEIDALLKMSQAAKPYAIPRLAIIQFANRFMSHLSERNLRLAKEVGPEINDFVDEACGTDDSGY